MAAMVIVWKLDVGVTGQPTPTAPTAANLLRPPPASKRAFAGRTGVVARAASDTVSAFTLVSFGWREPTSGNDRTVSGAQSPALSAYNRGGAVTIRSPQHRLICAGWEDRAGDRTPIGTPRLCPGEWDWRHTRETGDVPSELPTQQDGRTVRP